MDATKQPGIRIAQVFLVSAHFEHRPDFLSLPHTTPVEELPLEISVQIGTQPDGRVAALTLRVSSKEDSSALYRIDVTVGAFVEQKAGEENMSITDYAKASTFGLLYPFVREVVASLTGRGRFGPVWLHPINFLASTTWAQSYEAGVAPATSVNERPAPSSRSTKSPAKYKRARS